MGRVSRKAVPLLLVPPLLWIGGLLVVPQLRMLELSFRRKLPLSQIGGPEDVYTLENYVRFVENPLYWKVFVKTVVSAVVITLVAFLIAFPIAYFLAKVVQGAWSRRLFLAIVVPFWVNEIVRTFAWLLILTEQGVLNQVLVGLGLPPGSYLYTEGAVIVGMTYAYLLFMLFPLYASLESLDFSLVEAAQDLGAGWTRVLRHVILPHCVPGAVAGSIMVFMLAVGTYVVPAMLGGKSAIWFVQLIYTRFYDALNWNLGSALAFSLLVLSLGFVVVVLRVFRLSVGRVLQA
jgi:spermidine/putrescine transport system permease protein